MCITKICYSLVLPTFAYMCKTKICYSLVLPTFAYMCITKNYYSRPMAAYIAQQLRSLALRSAIEKEKTPAQQPKNMFVSTKAGGSQHGRRNPQRTSVVEEHHLDNDLLMSAGKVAQDRMQGE
jgi:hypothetical protein